MPELKLMLTQLENKLVLLRMLLYRRKKSYGKKLLFSIGNRVIAVNYLKVSSFS